MGDATANGSDGKMSSVGSTSASGGPYGTRDGKVGAAAPSAGGKIGGGSDAGGGSGGGGSVAAVAALAAAGGKTRAYAPGCQRFLNERSGDTRRYVARYASPVPPRP